MRADIHCGAEYKTLHMGPDTSKQDCKPNRLKPLATHLPDHLSGSRPAIATTVANWNLNPTTDITRLQGANRGILLPEFSSTA